MIILLIQFLLWTTIGQTWVAKRATDFLAYKLNTEVSVESVNISFFKFISLENLYIEDLNQDTLFYATSLSTEIDYWSFKNDSFSLNLGVVQIESPQYFLDQLPHDSITNLTRLFQPFSSNDTTSSLDLIQISANQIKIHNGKFNWINHNDTSNHYGVNWNNIGLTKINAEIERFEMVNDSFNADINHLSGTDISGFRLNQLSGGVIFSSSTTQIQNLHLVTPNSNISGLLNYQYDSIESFADFTNQVYMNYRLDSSLLNLKDIAFFAPSLEGLNEDLIIYGNQKGLVKSMRFQNIYLAYGNSTVLDGRVSISGLPDIENTRFNCNFKQLSSSEKDLSQIKTFPFAGNKTISIPKFLKNAGVINFKGKFNGFYHDFVTYGTFSSKNGQLSTDLKLVQKLNGTIHYDGAIKTTDFNLGELTNNEKLFGKTSIDIDVKGENLNFDDLNLQVYGSASKFDFLGYPYTDVKLDGTILKKVISGTLDIIDTNVNLSFDGKIDLFNAIPRYEFVAKIAHLKPKQLHILDRDSSATLDTKVIFNFKGSNLDNVLGRAGLEDFHFVENGKPVHLKKVDFTAYTSGKDKSLELESDNINLEITGQFKFNKIVQSFNHILYKWIPSIYASPPIKPKEIQNFHLVMQADKFSGFSAIFIPQVKFEKDLFIDLDYNSVNEEILLKSNSTQMSFFEQNARSLIVNSKLNIDTFQITANAKAYHFTDSNFIENVQLSAIAHQDLIQTNFKWNNHHSSKDDSGDLNFDINFTDPQNFKINTHNSWITLNDSLWLISDSSEIIKNKKEYTFNHIRFSQKNQQIVLNGSISENPDEYLNIDINHLNLAVLNPILNKVNINTYGSIHGSTKISNVYHEIGLQSKNVFDSLQLNNQYIGNGNFNSIWNQDKNRFEADINFTDKNIDKVKIDGFYYPSRSLNQLELNLKLDQFPLKTIEPFAVDIIDQVEGSISGLAKISGNIKAPIFNGDFEIQNVSTRVIYLNEVLSSNHQKVFIRPNLIGADAVIITDSKGKKSQVNFSLFHDNFDRINYDLSVTSIDIFRAFNTKQEDNSYFFGKVNLAPGSTLGIESDYYGNISLNADITSGKGTFVTIPFFEDDEIEQKDFIYFKDPENKSDTLTPNQKTEIESFGINLDMALELNKDAEIELLFDEYTNDKIEAKGKGNINLKITDKEDFNIYGTYEIEDGYYLFTFSNIISKKFKIKPGGKLSWNGSPYMGVADIDASYKVRTSLYDLGLSLDTSKARVPVEVVLNMSGNYLNPNLSFSFILPSKNEDVESMLNQLDDGEKNKQVFSLLILNKFLPLNGSDASTESSALTSNTSEVLSNQLSNWLSKSMDYVDVGFRYNPGQQTSGQGGEPSTELSSAEIEVALSTQLFNDRVSIETNMGFSDYNTTSSSGNNNFIGEWTVSYKMNKKGNVVTKVFTRSNEQDLVKLSTAPYTTGIGIAYTEPFKSGENLGCIISNHFKSKNNKRNCEEEYHQKQLNDHDENLEKVKKKVEKSRKKQIERNKKRKEK